MPYELRPEQFESAFPDLGIISNITDASLLAKTPEAFTYDADGNLTSDSGRKL